MRFERARTDEQIRERKEEIIKACSVLFDQYGADGVNFKAISATTSFARSTIYTYYSTKEEILLDLFLEDIKTWSLDVDKIQRSNQTMTREAYCRALTDTYVQNVRMLQLLSLCYSTLEQNCSLEKLTEFKKELWSRTKPFIMSIHKFFPNASDEAKEAFLFNSSCLVAGLYPATNMRPRQKEAFKNAGIKHRMPSFEEMCYKGLLALTSAL